MTCSETVLKNDFCDCVYKIEGDEDDPSAFQALVAASGRWEPAIGRLMSRLVGPTDICLDIGANIGLSTLLMSDLAARGRVHAFETRARAFEFLKENLHNNHRINVEAHRLDLSDGAGDRASTNLDGESGQDDEPAIRHAALDVLKRDVSSQEPATPLTTLDAWAREKRIETIDFIRLDGREPVVVRGGLKLLLRSKCKLITKIKTKDAGIRKGAGLAAYFSLLSDIFSYIYLIEEHRLTRIHTPDDIVPRRLEGLSASLLCVHEAIDCYPAAANLLGSAQRDGQKGPVEKRAAPVRALYFTAIPISWTNNGGSLVCRNHIRELAMAEGVHLTVAVFGAPELAEENKAFAHSVGAEYIQLEFQLSPKSKWPPRLPRNVLHIQEKISETFFVPDETWSHISDRHDVVVIDWMMSAFYAKGLLELPIPKVMITLNPEGAYYEKELRDACGRLSLAQRLSVARMKRKEKHLYASMNGIIALNERDVPKGSLARKLIVLRPLLKERSSRWSPKDKSVAFVGNIGHPPNRRAIEWLCTRLADRLACRAPNVLIKIVGASADVVAADWRRPNVEFIGVADRSAVTALLTDAYLFLAPIDNDYGSKIKVLECLAHGTPFLATCGAESGVPFLSAARANIDLDGPDEAADAIASLLDSPEALKTISRRNTADLENFRRHQQGMLATFLKDIVTSHAPKA